jgi:mannose-1-phosphate guanylyltransferase / mannose-6-phosphate isomerase
MRGAITPLILCGGFGTSLWPLSRDERPKQFVSPFGSHSVFQETMLRVSGSKLFGRPIVQTNRLHRFTVLEQLAEISVEADIVLEPVRRNTGPAILAGSTFARRRAVDAVVLAIATNHTVADRAEFVATCEAALAQAAASRIVMFGVPPHSQTGHHGYIGPGEPIGGSMRAVSSYISELDSSSAATYIENGYLLNSGNLLFSADVMLSEYAKYDPANAARVTRAVEDAGRDLAFVTLNETAFDGAAPQSIDGAVLEQTSLAAVIPVSWDWTAVGSWQAVYGRSAKSQEGNAAYCPAVFENSRNCFVTSDKALVALAGVDDLVIVATQDAVFVSRRNCTDGLKHLVAKLKTAFPQVTDNHLKVHRPWGAYQSVDVGERHQVKRITVTAGGRLSLQKHHHRAEHWIVVHGTAKVTVNDMVTIVHENESIYIPIGAVHRLENPGKIPLQLIEVQTGSYLGEDDIIRIEDDYRRVP